MGRLGTCGARASMKRKTRALFMGILLGALAQRWEAPLAALADDHHQSGDGAGADEEEKNGPFLFEFEPGKKKEPPFILKPGRYRVSHHLHSGGPFLASVTLVEEEGGLKRIPLIEQSSREAKVTQLSGEETYTLFGRYELEYRFRGEDFAGDLAFELIEESPTPSGLFSGVYLGILERVEQVSTLRRNPVVLREQRVSFVIRQDDKGIRVEQDGLPLASVSAKGSVLIGAMSQPSTPVEGEAECQEDQTFILQKKVKSSGRLRVFARHSCPDGTYLWNTFSGTVVRK